jgi:tetratricopeptide (TPR) repeat protein
VSYVPDAAVAYYEKALAMLPVEPEQMPRRIRLFEGLGEMLRWQARLVESLHAFQSMRAAAETCHDPLFLARAWNAMAWVQELLGDYRTSLESAGRAQGVITAALADANVEWGAERQSRAQAELGRALFNKGWNYYRLGDPETALVMAEQALAHSDKLAIRRDRALSMNLLGNIHAALQHDDRARHFYQQALLLYQESGDRWGVARILNNLGETARVRGLFAEAARLYQEALQIAREISDRDGEILFLSNLGGAKVGLGEYENAERELRVVLDMAEAASWGGLSETFRFLAEACLGQGKTDAAQEAATQALLLARDAEERESAAAAWRVLGMVAARANRSIPIDLHRNGKIEQLSARDCFSACARVFRDLGATGELAHTLTQWATYELDCGDTERGRAMWADARSLFLDLGQEAAVQAMDKQRPPAEQE